MKTLLPAFLAAALAGVACAVATDAPGLLAAGQTGAATRDGSPEGRAIAFLSREVPRWPVENNCYSCHNNGDAARALYTAVRLDYPVEPDALRDTSAWLQSPGEWDGNATDQEFSDKALARIQFAGALVHAMDAGVTDDRAPLIRASALVAEDQKPDGSWQLDSGGSIGSPAAYGTYLATSAARRVLVRTELERFEPAIALADRWLREVEVRTVLDAAAVIMGLDHAADSDAVRQRQHCLELIVKGQAPAGGWGAYLTSPTEPFDTALVVLALLRLLENPRLASPIMRETDLQEAVMAGRSFLLERQLADGSWLETTRPPGQQSYAQYISTSGWATLALLATQGLGEVR